MLTRRGFLDLAAGAALVATAPKQGICSESATQDPADAASQTEPSFKGRIELDARESVPAWPSPVTAPKGAPNVVLILLDDAGYGATSTFGGPTETPVLSRLASKGLRYNRFHVTALCSPSRACLLSGRNDHRMGFGDVMELVSGHPGYDGIWKKEGASIPKILRQNGYSTAAFGKWHNTPYWELRPTGPFDRWPTTLGFDYYYGFMMGEGSEWEPDLFRDTVAIPRPTKPEYYLTSDLVNEAISWFHTHRSITPEKPYFLYFAPGATHAPHMVPKEWIAKFLGRFDMGWDKLREETFQRQKRLGIIPNNAELTPRPEEIPAWDSLSQDERKLFTRQMEVYAAYLACTDAEIGRLLDVVQAGVDGENTLIMYIAGDNGASADDGLTGLRWQSVYRSMSQRLEHLDELGGPTEENAYAAGWAWAMDTPFKWTKRIASHFGGTRDPLIVSWLARIKDQGGLRTQFSHLNDIAPTIYEAAGIPFPAVVDGVKQMPLDGTSLVFSFDRPEAPSQHRIQVFEQMGNQAIYQDGWIAASRHIVPWEACPDRSYTQDKWELYHIDEDFSEAHDLADRYPKRLTAMKQLFDVQARENNIYPLGAGLCGGPRRFMGQDPNEAPRKSFVFYPDLPLMHSLAGPDFSESHLISADVFLPPNVSGILLSVGTRFSGFTFYVKNGHLRYERHSLGNSYTLATLDTIPLGDVELAFKFTRSLSGTLRGEGDGLLLVNSNSACAAQKLQAGPIVEGHFCIGNASGSPLGPENVAPFKFTGRIKQIRVDITYDIGSTAVLLPPDALYSMG